MSLSTTNSKHSLSSLSFDASAQSDVGRNFVWVRGKKHDGERVVEDMESDVGGDSSFCCLVK